MIASTRVVQNINDAIAASTRVETPFRQWLLDWQSRQQLAFPDNPIG